MTHLLVAIFALAIGFGAHFLSKTDDSPLEEAMEHIIKEESGMDIDLSSDHKAKLAAEAKAKAAQDPE